MAWEGECGRGGGMWQGVEACVRGRYVKICQMSKS